MQKRQIEWIAACLMLMLALGGCRSSVADGAGDVLFQISTIQALTAGDYSGSASVEELLEHGDIGLGTFEGVDGEMIVLDGVCYQAPESGRVIEADGDSLVPFAAVTFLDADVQKDFDRSLSFAELKDELDALVAEQGANSFYVCRIDGAFDSMQVRTERRQEEPYRPLDAVMETDQIVFRYAGVSGTLVAIYCPAYAAGVNASGWHFHFLDDARETGGHVLDLRMSSGRLTLDKTDAFSMQLPQSESFDRLDLSGQSDAVAKVESGGGSR